MPQTTFVSRPKRIALIVAATAAVLMALPASASAPPADGPAAPEARQDFTLLSVSPEGAVSAMPSVDLPNYDARSTIIAVDPEVFESNYYCLPTRGSRGELGQELIEECLRLMEEQPAAGDSDVPDARRFICRPSAGPDQTDGNPPLRCVPAS